ncbi:Collagen alpha-1(XXVI) chain [Orchesella cincta]|uniref:Collagen alpha-1(XXVI) chain n=1 Tax=Orchesella cincta TaxID=48709 RepID=A0A1D2ND58_ORCCI|nr:Collagen alpha-1(XXVI) chain [Orchesella cincta]
MKSLVPVKLVIFTFYVLSTCFTISWTLYSGSWCPYQTEKVVPCRVRNGSEPYYGPNICWRNDNGSYSCTKKILYRPKYATTYKKVMETKYKCCPGLDGPECENECFNCTTYKKMDERVAAAERRLSRMEKSFPKTNDRLDRFHRDFMNQNSIYSAPAKELNSDISLAYATLSLRVQTILDEFREMENRIRLLENELSRLNTQVDDLTLSNNIAYDYSSASGRDNKDGPTVGVPVSSNTHASTFPSTTSHRHSVKTESTFRVLEENLERGDIASTLNDDYGDELFFDNSTEQYIDQLQLKREHSSP